MYPATGEGIDDLDARLEPWFEPPASPPLRKQENAESDLTKDYGIDHDVPFVSLEPFDDTSVGASLCRINQGIGVDETLHRASVESDSMGVKNPFSGQLSNQSTRPSFGGFVRRTNR